MTLFVLQAVDVQKEELYAEPSYFYQPAKPCLGAVLQQQGRVAEAEAVFREDLKELPGNAWSMEGLKQAVKGTPSQGLAGLPGDKAATSCPAFLL